MTVVSIIFYLVALGLAALGLRFLLADGPLDYHAEIMQSDDSEISEHTTFVIIALYRVLGGFMIGSAVAIAGVTMLWMGTDTKAAALLLGLFGLIAAGNSAYRVHYVARTYGVNAPWKPALVFAVALVGTAAYAFVAA